MLSMSVQASIPVSHQNLTILPSFVSSQFAGAQSVGAMIHGKRLLVMSRLPDSPTLGSAFVLAQCEVLEAEFPARGL
jgi:hypothetical protein